MKSEIAASLSRLLGCILLTCSIVAADSLSRAQEASVPSVPEAAEPPEYRAALALAVAEHQAGNFQEARAHFLQAHALFPNARTLRGLGWVEFELRNYGEALRYLSEALSSPVRPLEGALAAETRALWQRTKNYVSEVHLDLRPETTEVLLNGATVARGPKAALTLMIGDHLLEFRALGRMSERRAVRVQGGEQIVLEVVLKPPAAPEHQAVAPAKPRDPTTAVDDRSRRKKLWLWIGLGAAAIAAGVTASVLALHSDDTKEPAAAPDTLPGVILTGLSRR